MTKDNLSFMIKDLFKEIGAHKEVEIYEPNFYVDKDYLLTKPLVGKFRLTNIGDFNILVEGTAKTEVKCVCSRCLVEFFYPVEVTLVEKIPPQNQVKQQEKEEVFSYNNTNYILSLQEMLRQSIILALPIRSLCKENCRGLCDQCGANLNEILCNCKK